MSDWVIESILEKRKGGFITKEKMNELIEERFKQLREGKK